MKKLFSLFLCNLILISSAGCSTNQNDTTSRLQATAITTPSSDTTILKIEHNNSIDQSETNTDKNESSPFPTLEPLIASPYPTHEENINEATNAQSNNTDTMTKTQKNSIAMLNYLTSFVQEIYNSKNSRVYLEQAYKTLENNTHPNAIDRTTLSEINSILDILENYRMISIKRERLAYIYEQNKAKALRQAIPNPLSLIAVVQSGNLVKLATSVLYMAVDSYTSYSSYTDELDLQYLQDGWALDDEEAEAVHNSRKSAFTYMVKMVNDYDLPGDYALSMDMIDEYVKWKNSDNNFQKLQFLESNMNTYKEYGDYWLTLAKSYYEDENYQGCYDAVQTYLNFDVTVFRKDYNLANVLPLAIISAEKLLDKDSYLEIADNFATMIIDNCSHDDWSLRYFASEVYIGLYSISNDNIYLEKSYNITKNSINYLIEEQQKLNTTYLNNVKTEKIPSNATKDEKKDIKNYNKMLKEQRKKELPPVYQPLYLNCEVLLFLADKLNISSSERQRIDKMLRNNGDDSIFLTKPLDDKCWFSKKIFSNSSELEVNFDQSKLTIPASYTSESTIITSEIISANGNKQIIKDWIIDKVDRKNDDFKSFTTIFSSKSSKEYKYKEGDIINIIITPYAESNLDNLTFSFKAEQKKSFIFSDIIFKRNEK